MRKLVECAHCGGAKQCRSHGGKSCDQCLLAAGRRPKDWAMVRCSFCGGRGRVWVVEEDAPSADEAPVEAVPDEPTGASE